MTSNGSWPTRSPSTPTTSSSRRPTGQGSLIATSRQYPALYSAGEDNVGQNFATLVHSFTAGGGACPSFRLYRVLGHPPVT